MKHSIRFSIIALLLFTTFFVGSVVYTHTAAYACGSSIVNGSTTTFEDNNLTYTVTFSLWYNSCNSQNYTSGNVTSGSIPGQGWSLLVVREPGPDGGGDNAGSGLCPHPTGICTSKGVYSPHNKSFAELQIIDVGSIDSSAF